jgi:hypothetical protein
LEIKYFKSNVTNLLHHFGYTCRVSGFIRGVASLEGDSLEVSTSVPLNSDLIWEVAVGGGGLIRGVASLEEDSLEVSTSVPLNSGLIWEVAVCGSGLKRGVASLEGDSLVVSISVPLNSCLIRGVTLVGVALLEVGYCTWMTFLLIQQKLILNWFWNWQRNEYVFNVLYF